MFGSVLLLWASLGFTKVAQTAMAEIWRVPRRLRPGFWQNLGRSVWALAALSLPTLVTAAVTIVTARVKNPMRAMNDVPSWLLSSIGVTAAVAAAVVFLAFNFGAHLLAFRALTPHVIATRRLVPGTVLFTLFWTALTAFGSAILASRVARANQLYGTIGFVIGLIFWIYLGAYGALLSSELNAVSTEHLYPRTLFGPPATPADRRALLSRAQTEEFVPGQVVEVRFGPPREPEVDAAAGDGRAGQDGGPHRLRRPATGPSARSGRQDAGQRPHRRDEPDAGHDQRAGLRRGAEVALVGLGRRPDQGQHVAHEQRRAEGQHEEGEVVTEELHWAPFRPW